MSPVVEPKGSGNKPKTTATASLRLPLEMLAELDAVAKETGRSRNDVAVRLLRFALDAHHNEPNTPKKPKR